MYPDTRIDLNLYRILDAIYVQGGISAAARALHLTQPAVTHALNRLRDQFDDPLFVRQGNRMVPTARTCAVIGDVQHHLRGLQSAMRMEAEFDPAVLDMEMVIGSRDLLESIALQSLVAVFAQEAPGLRLASRQVPLDMIERVLSSGQVDLVVERQLRPTPRLSREHLLDDILVVAMRRDHPLSDGPLRRADYFEAQHISVSPHGGPSTLDMQLENDGRFRKIKLVCQHYFAACQIAAAGDLLLTLPRTYALRLAALLPMTVQAVPLHAKPYPILAYWHESRTPDPVHQWFRQRVFDTIRGTSP